MRFAFRRAAREAVTPPPDGSTIRLRELAEAVAPLGDAGPEAKGIVGSRYAVLGEVGRGGIGVVLKAHDANLGRDVALKVLDDRHRHDRVLLRRFLEEAQIAGQLQHPGIVPVHDLVTAPDQRPYFAMKLIAGRTLAQVLRDRRDLHDDQTKLVAVFLQVCQTVAYAHARGVVHRDLKPSNIMIGAFGEVQVMDWGLAKLLGASVGRDGMTNADQVSAGVTARTGSASGAVFGTPAYMAPEQARGEVDRVDRRADVFGLGAVLCEILTGRPPFQGDTSDAIRQRAAAGDVADARRWLAGVGDTELAQIAARCLEAEPEDRYPDASAVADALGAHLAAVGERARRAELGAAEARVQADAARRARRLTQRWSVALLAVFGIGLTATTWGLLDASEQRERAETSEALARTEAARAKTVLGFVDDLLSAADPHAQKGKNFTVRQLLDEFDHGLGERLRGEPEVEASVRRLIGNAYVGLGLPDQAEPHLERAVALRRQRFGDDHETVAESLADQAGLLHDRGKYGEALQRLDEAKAIAVAVYGAEHENVAAIESAQCDMLRHLDRYEQALQLGRDLIDRSNRRPGTSPLSTANQLDNLAKVHVDRGEHAEAERLLRRALALLRSQPTTDSLTVARILGDLGWVLTRQDELHEAEEILREALAIRRALFGDEPLFTAQCMGNLAVAIAGSHPEEARQLFEQAQTTIRELQGEDHPALAGILRDRARAAFSADRFAEAEDLGRQALAIHRRVDEDSTEAAWTQVDLAQTLLALGRLDEAESLARSGVAGLRKRLGALHRGVAQAMTIHAFVSIAMRKDAEAEAALREALAICRAQPSDAARDVAKALDNLGTYLRDTGRLAASESMHREALEQLRSVHGEQHAEVARSMHNLGRSYAAQGKLTEAEQTLRQALAMQQELLGEEHADVAWTLDRLAGVLTKRNRFVEAEDLYRRALATRRKSHGDPHRSVAIALNNLAGFLSDRGEYDAAIELYQEAIEMARKVFGSQHPEVANKVDNLGGSLAQQGKPALAEALLREAYDTRLAVLGRDHPDTANTRWRLGSVLLAQRKHQEAEDLARIGLEACRRLHAPGDPAIADALVLLGATLLPQGRHAEAEPLLRECLAIRAEKLVGDWRLYSTMSLLGEALAGQGRHEAADELLRDGHDRMQPPPRSAFRKREALERLIRHYEAWGKTEEAERRRQELGAGAKGTSK